MKLLVALAAIGAVSAQSIPEIASNDPNFSTLVAALTAADLVDVLSGDGPFTVRRPRRASNTARFRTALRARSMTLSCRRGDPSELAREKFLKMEIAGLRADERRVRQAPRGHGREPPAP